jgi:hypothetical protein
MLPSNVSGDHDVPVSVQAKPADLLQRGVPVTACSRHASIGSEFHHERHRGWQIIRSAPPKSSVPEKVPDGIEIAG